MSHNELLEEAAVCLRNILEIGKRNMSNPKYDGYFDEAWEVLQKLNAEKQTFNKPSIVEGDRFWHVFNTPGTENGVYVVGVNPCKDGLAPSDLSAWVKDGENGWKLRGIKDMEFTMQPLVIDGHDLSKGVVVLNQPSNTPILWGKETDNIGRIYSEKILEDKSNPYPVKGLKKVARRLRNKEKQPSLTNILINLRSWHQPSSWFNEKVKKAVLSKYLVWDYGKRTHVLETLKGKGVNIERLNCPNTPRPEFGHKTYFKDGKYFSYDPIFDEIPF